MRADGVDDAISGAASRSVLRLALQYCMLGSRGWNVAVDADVSAIPSVGGRRLRRCVESRRADRRQQGALPYGLSATAFPLGLIAVAAPLGRVIPAVVWSRQRAG